MSLEALLEELRGNLACLRADLGRLERPEGTDPEDGEAFGTGYRFEAYEAFQRKLGYLGLDPLTGQLLQAFYKSLRVLREGHPGLMQAEPKGLKRALRITVEAALSMGEQLLQRLEDGGQSGG